MPKVYSLICLIRDMKHKKGDIGYFWNKWLSGETNIIQYEVVRVLKDKDVDLIQGDYVCIKVVKDGESVYREFISDKDLLTKEELLIKIERL